MFDKETYIRRRTELKRLVGKGIILLFGNNEAPANYPANGYAPFRQDSSFLYYFGQHRDGLVGVIDIDNDEEWLFGDDIDVEDIVWMGYRQPHWPTYQKWSMVNGQWSISISCPPIATTLRFRSWICWAFTPQSRKRLPA